VAGDGREAIGAMPPVIDPPMSDRARAIAEGLVRTKRAVKGFLKRDHGMLRLHAMREGFYWISLGGTRVLRGTKLFEAEELQPKFIDAMERAGR